MSETSSMYDNQASVDRFSINLHDDSKKKTHAAKTPVPSLLDRIFHTTTQKSGLHYFTKAKSIKTGEKKEYPQIYAPFQYPQTEDFFTFKQLDALWKRRHQYEERKKKYYDKQNVISKLRGDILERLYVEDPEDIKGMKTLLDLDPEFFTIVEGRPVQKPFSMSTYLEHIRNVLRTKLMAGFRNDEMLLIEEKLKRERSAIESIRQNYTTYLNSFEACLNDDYNESMAYLREADQAALQTIIKTEEIRKLHVENAALEFTVHKLEERWRDLKMYQKFLYFVSPITWRKKYDYIHRKELEDDLETEASSIFKKYTLSSQGHIPSLTNLVEEYLQCIQKEEEPLLYFTNTQQLIKVFRFIEIQNLNCLLHTEEIEIPMENMKVSMKEAKENFEKEAANIQSTINKLYTGIEWEKSCAEELKEMAMKQVEGTFKNLISDDEVLRLHVFIEDVYESCICKNDTELNIFDMMVATEQQYNNLVRILDGLPFEVVKVAEKHRFAEQARLAKLCEETAQKIALVDSITWRLKKSLEPPFVKKRDLMWRSAPPEKIEKPPPPPRELTAKEKEYLNYFTVYCALTDKVEDYGIDLQIKETDLRKFSVMDIPDENKK